MQFEQGMKSHEINLRQLRLERHAEEQKLSTLKAQLQNTLAKPQQKLFAAYEDGRVNAA